ncbi:MAG: hypothetical protein IKM84_08055 [Oscillospiraceae bacterium]|nr:hypothetical protein [Oscillospiraceae bacterium]
MIINDKTLIQELCSNDLCEPITDLIERTKKQFEGFEHPLDDSIVGANGKLKELLVGDEMTIVYTKAQKLDELWRELLNKSIICLRYFDQREPFLDNPDKSIVAYGIDALEEYHKRYIDFESLLYGGSSYYRDHVFHVIRVWMLGVFCMLKTFKNDERFISKLSFDGGAQSPGEINYLEYISMWTIASLCHDLGYPLEKAEQILEKTRKMMREFIPNPNIWNNFSYSGTQDNINEYILKFISTKMKEAKVKPEDSEGQTNDLEGQTANVKFYVGRIQPKYYLKYAKSLEGFQHGIISTVIIYKMLLFFLESDFNLNDDHLYRTEDARQFYIRREILRAIASHTCPDAYNIHITTFSSLLFLCDEMQEWGRKTWNELYTGLHENSVSLFIEAFSSEEIAIREEIDMKSAESTDIVIQNILRVFDRQYSLYKTTFRDGQDTAKRDFDLKKTIVITMPTPGADELKISVEYGLPRTGASYFMVDLSKAAKGSAKRKEKELEKYKKDIMDRLSKKLYCKDLHFTN